MRSNTHILTSDLTVNDIVINNYRTADVFRKYNIDFCCGGRTSINKICEFNDLNESMLLEELQEYANSYQQSGHWSLDFMIDYLINIHHEYFNNNMAIIQEYVNKFITSHGKKYPELLPLPIVLQQLFDILIEQIKYEGLNLFPYIRRIAYADSHNEVYGKHLIKSFHKLSVNDLNRYHLPINLLIPDIERITNYFTLPENACITHAVMLQKLEEFIDQLRQYIFIETKYLVPLTLDMEKHLLEKYIEN